MSYNDGAQIVPMAVSIALLRGLAPNADLSALNDTYARLQRLTESAASALVSQAWGPSFLDYGSDSPDFPLCFDFALCCLGALFEQAAETGLAVRPEVFGLNYTKTDGRRHAILCFPLVDRAPIFMDPQSEEWMDGPADCKTMDRFWL